MINFHVKKIIELMNHTNTSAVTSSLSLYRYIFFHSIKNNSTLVQWWSFTFLLFKHNITCYVLGHWLSGEFCLRWKSDDTREQKWKIEHRIFNASVYWVLHPFILLFHTFFTLDWIAVEKKIFFYHITIECPAVCWNKLNTYFLFAIYMDF